MLVFNCLRLFVTVWVHVWDGFLSFETVCVCGGDGGGNCFDMFGTVWSCLEQFGVVWIYWDCLGQFGCLLGIGWDCLGACSNLFGTVWDSLGACVGLIG